MKYLHVFIMEDEWKMNVNVDVDETRVHESVTRRYTECPHGKQLASTCDRSNITDRSGLDAASSSLIFSVNIVVSSRYKWCDVFFIGFFMVHLNKW